MSASVVLALAVLLATGVLAVFGRLLHRDLAQIADQLARSGHQPDLRLYVDQLRGEAQDLHQKHVQAVDTRIRDVETATVDLRKKNADVARYVGWMVPWVERWATQAERR